jgi:hypothetical protein
VRIAIAYNVKSSSGYCDEAKGKMSAKYSAGMYGKTGNQWLDEAWFTVTPKNESLPVQAVTLEQCYDLKNALIERKNKMRPAYREHLENSLAALKQARLQIEQENTRYVWAFPRFYDVLAFLWLRSHPQFHHYAKPASLIEEQFNQLFARFPYDAAAQLDTLIFEASEICEDSRFGSSRSSDLWRSVGIVNSALRETNAVWRYSHWGFQYGLYLVAVEINAPIYRMTEGQAVQLQSEAIALINPIKPKRDRRLGFPRPSINMNGEALDATIETVLLPTFKRVFRVEPGQPLPKNNE